MKLQINDYCIRCGICEDVYPDIFKRNYDTHNIDVLFDEIPEEKQERAEQAAADCAVAAIKIIR
ncbi:MAG: ferredoxin [Parasporobacterium sp.]|nr:ferredoxin [Parasporobacterium sp.]